MNTETVILRDNPKFKIVVSTNQFEITDKAHPNTSITYSYDLTDKIELNKERTNWLLTVLSYVVEFFTGTAIGAGGLYKEKNKLGIIYNGQSKEILLTNCDINKAIEAIEKISSRLNKNTYT